MCSFNLLITLELNYNFSLKIKFILDFKNDIKLIYIRINISLNILIFYFLAFFEDNNISTIQFRTCWTFTVLQEYSHAYIYTTPKSWKMDKNYKNGYTSNVLSEKTVQVTLNIKLLNFIIIIGHTNVKDMCHKFSRKCHVHVTVYI